MRKPNVMFTLGDRRRNRCLDDRCDRLSVVNTRGDGRVDDRLVYLVHKLSNSITCAVMVYMTAQVMYTKLSHKSWPSVNQVAAGSMRLLRLPMCSGRSCSTRVKRRSWVRQP